jgi:Protein of unknown function (DUF3892)
VATYYIKAVRVEPVNAPAWHEHIALVKLTDDRIIARGTVIAMIRAGDEFYTAASPPGKVYVHPCPHCRDSDYITTHPDSTPTNNLLHLPRF